jgi:hypothetical protein
MNHYAVKVTKNIKKDNMKTVESVDLFGQPYFILKLIRVLTGLYYEAVLNGYSTEILSLQPTKS